MKKVNLKKIVVFAAVILLLIFLHFIKVITPLERVAVMMLNPFSRLAYSTTSFFRLNGEERLSIENLSGELAKLKQENESLISENAKMKNLEIENSFLRDQLKFTAEHKYNYILADIIFRSSTDPQYEGIEEIIINQGKNKNLVPGYALVNEEGTIIGKITKVEDYIAKACLVTDNTCKFAASVQNQERTVGVTQGDFGLTIKMDYIPQTENINVGDNVITSGLEKNVPRGLLIGQISKINKESNEVWQNAVVESPAKLNKLLFVSVLIP
jgi:rod shape-determining protein MreC